MGKSTVVVMCDNCGKKLRLNEDHLSAALEGRVKCPHCDMVLRPQMDSLIWRPEGNAQGEELKRRENAILSVRNVGGVAMVKFLTSRLRDTTDVARLEEELTEVLDQHELHDFVLNFEKLKFMSSSVISVLMRLKTKVDATGGRLVLCNISSDVYEVLKIMRLHKLLDIRKTEEEAVRALKKRTS